MDLAKLKKKRFKRSHAVLGVVPRLITEILTSNHSHVSIPSTKDKQFSWKINLQEFLVGKKNLPSSPNLQRHNFLFFFFTCFRQRQRQL